MLALGILTISDKGFGGERRDESGEVLKKLLSTLGEVKKYEIIPDALDMIKDRLTNWSEELDLILTTGGTGLGERDVTPEATLEVVDKIVPGIAEAMRSETFKIAPTSILSRGISGVKKGCLIINLPGSPKAVKECLEVIMPVLPHAVGIIKGEIGEHRQDSGRG